MLNDEIQEAYAEINRLKVELRLRDALWPDGIKCKEGEDYNVDVEAIASCSENVPQQSASV